MATTPVSLIPWALAKAAVNARKLVSKASGSSARSTRLNVSWLGMPYSNGRNCRSTFSFERANNAMSVAPFAPHSVAASAMMMMSSKS
jgi:hypothetical protein